jgi:hypothetical protein
MANQGKFKKITKNTLYYVLDERTVAIRSLWLKNYQNIVISFYRNIDQKGQLSNEI